MTKPTREEVERWSHHRNLRGSKVATLVNAYLALLDENERLKAVVKAARKASKLAWDAMEDMRSQGDIMNKEAAGMVYTAHRILKEALAKLDGGGHD